MGLKASELAKVFKNTLSIMPAEVLVEKRRGRHVEIDKDDKTHQSSVVIKDQLLYCLCLLCVIFAD